MAGRWGQGRSRSLGNGSLTEEKGGGETRSHSCWMWKWQTNSIFLEDFGAWAQNLLQVSLKSGLVALHGCALGSRFFGVLDVLTVCAVNISSSDWYFVAFASTYFLWLLFTFYAFQPPCFRVCKELRLYWILLLFLTGAFAQYSQLSYCSTFWTHYPEGKNSKRKQYIWWSEQISF